MARAKKNKVEASIHAIPVQFSRVLVTIEADDPIWTSGEGFAVPSCSIVRIFPPIDATEERVSELQEWCAKTASAVRVMPRRKAAIVVVPKEKKPHVKTREVVMQLAADSNFEDRVSLAIRCERIMGRVGL